MLKGFKQFILRGNVVDFGVGVVVGAAFVAVINALVKDLLTPLIAAVAAKPDFSSFAFTVHGSRFAYGDFFNALISFVIVAVVVYLFVVLPINTLVARSHREPPTDLTTKKCPECLSEIPLDATRCAHCTSKLS